MKAEAQKAIHASPLLIIESRPIPRNKEMKVKMIILAAFDTGLARIYRRSRKNSSENNSKSANTSTPRFPGTSSRRDAYSYPTPTKLRQRLGIQAYPLWHHATLLPHYQHYMLTLTLPKLREFFGLIVHPFA